MILNFPKNRCWFLFALLSLLIIENNKAQQHFCGTMEQYTRGELKNPDSFSNTLARDGSSWNLNAGYGAGCAKDCNIANLITCGNNDGDYILPVVFTVSTSTGCANTAPSQSVVDRSFNLLNDYFDCIGLPIEVVKATGYTGAPTTGDRSTRFLNAGCNYSTASVSEIPDVMNVFIFSNTGNGTGCNGFAPLPFTTSSPGLSVVMGASCINNTSYVGGLSCATLPINLGVVFVHEVGHFLGLYHTHGDYTPGPHPNYPGNGGNNSASNNYYGTISEELVDGSNACTTGDYIADTAADIGISHALDSQGTASGSPAAVPNPIGGCATGTSCAAIVLNCTDANNDIYVPDLTNLMNYNNSGFCRNSLSQCQKSKMVDALVCARANLCDRDVTVEFTNGAADVVKEICAGDSAPTFTAANCYTWHDGLGSNSNQLAMGTSFTPPTGTGAGQLDNNTPGTYTWYLGDVNEYNFGCRTAVTVKVVADPGAVNYNGSSSVVNACSGSPFDFTTVGENTGDATNIIGYYFSDSDPTTTITTQTAINNAINNANSGTPLNLSTGNIIQSNSGNPLTNLNNLPIDCNSLGGDGIYYLTPFVAYGDPPVTCTAYKESTSVPWDFGGSGMHGGALTTNIGPLSCSGSTAGLTLQSISVVLEVTTYTGNNTSGLIRFDIRDPNEQFGCGGINTAGSTNLSCGSTPCTLNIPLSSISANMEDGDYNPLTDAFCISAVDFPSDASTVIEYNVTVTVVYAGNNASSVWNSNGTPNIGFTDGQSSANCFWGDPIIVDCNCSTTCIPTITLSGPANNVAAITTTSNSITSSEVITGNSDVVYQSNCIQLDFPFEVGVGVQFLAEINPCAPLTDEEDESKLKQETDEKTTSKSVLEWIKEDEK